MFRTPRNFGILSFQNISLALNNILWKHEKHEWVQLWKKSMITKNIRKSDKKGEWKKITTEELPKSFLFLIPSRKWPKMSTKNGAKFKTKWKPSIFFHNFRLFTHEFFPYFATFLILLRSTEGICQLSCQLLHQQSAVVSADASAAQQRHLISIFLCRQNSMKRASISPKIWTNKTKENTKTWIIVTFSTLNTKKNQNEFW